MNRAAVTVAVVAYHSADDLPDCLASIRSQVGIDVEVIVVDNAAGERPPDMTAPEERLCARHDDVRYVPSENVGFGESVNRAFALADTEHLAACNPDAELAEHCLARLVATHRTTDAGVAIPKILLADEPARVSTCGLQCHVTGLAFNRGHGFPADHPSVADPGRVGGLSGCAFLTTRSTWDRLGGFDEELFLYKDDVSLSWACGLADVPIRYDPTARVHHDYEGRVDGEKLHQIERGRLLLLAKYLPRSALVGLAPALVLAELLAWAMAASVGLAGCAGKLRAYRVLASADRRSIRERGAPFRRRFPARIGALEATIPWGELTRGGRVPDLAPVRWVGALVDAAFRANVRLYCSLAGPGDVAHDAEGGAGGDRGDGGDADEGDASSAGGRYSR